MLGVSEEGQCFEVLALEMGDRERADLWENVFGSLVERGLNAEAVELGIMDGLPGLEALFKRFFPLAQTQRCQKHAKAQACQRVRKAEREEFSKGVNQISYARNESAAQTAKCFGFVQTYDTKPRRRLWELMKTQEIQENQQVMFLSDGGENIRQVREYLHPNSEHVIDRFHITMRLTVLQQQVEALEGQHPEIGAAAAKQLETIKHLLWHGNVEDALERLNNLLVDLDLIRDHSGAAQKLAAGVAEFVVYIRNNQESIPNYGERYRQGETISTAFVESTINQVVSRRFLKKQQMHWTLRGAHLLLQTRTKVLNNELEEAFRRWYPLFRVQAKAA